MKRNHKIAILSTSFCVVMALSQSCANWLDVTEFDKIPADEFWQTKEDVDGIVSGAYTSFRNSNETIFKWTEVRGDGVELNSSYNADATFVNNYNDIKSLEITPENGFVQYSDMYRTINRCNLVIKYAPGVLDLDETFTQDECDRYIAEMKWLRCLCYFYLVRSFCDVPYVTEPTMDDKVEFAVPKTEGRKILETIKAELEEITAPYTGKLPPVYAGALGWEQRGRGTIYAGYALLADICLWLGLYPETVTYCDKVLNVSGENGLYELVAYPEREDPEDETSPLVFAEDWYNQLFGNKASDGWSGNSRESIFELNWGSSQNNSLFGWFHNGDANQIRFLITQKTIDLFNDETYAAATGDKRGAGATYLAANRRGWKYVGLQNGGGVRGDANRRAPLIIYRLADIYLMKAEALIMQGGTDNYQEAYDLIKTIRFRAGYDTTSTSTQPPVFTTEKEALTFLLEERQREFTTECKRWYDLVRVAWRDDQKNKDMIIDFLVNDLPASERELYRAKLQDPYAYFFPIHADEIDASGGVLEQNPYYE